MKLRFIKGKLGFEYYTIDFQRCGYFHTNGIIQGFSDGNYYNFLHFEISKNNFSLTDYFDGNKIISFCENEIIYLKEQ